MLADMAINLELARLMTYRSAQEVDLGKPGAYFASIAKCFAADTANQAAANAVQVNCIKAQILKIIVFCDFFEYFKFEQYSYKIMRKIDTFSN